jgi:AbrB family looped-hinge helix DNA binding protein
MRFFGADEVASERLRHGYGAFNVFSNQTNRMNLQAILFSLYYCVLSMTAEEVVVTRKGQVTIPVKIRRKFKKEENSKVKIVEENGEIVIKKQLSIFDLAGSSAGKVSVEEVKRMLDEMRAEDA